MGDVKIRYYVVKRWKDQPPRGYWQPCLARPNKKTGVFEPTLMAKLGFEPQECGIDGPQAWAFAESWNAKWDQARQAFLSGKIDVTAKSIERVFPAHSVGDGFAHFRGTAVWKTKKKRTKEDWLRAWKHIAPMFGDVDPNTLSMDHMSLWYMGDGDKIQGLLQTIGVREAYRAMKIWRALWEVLGTINRPDGKRYVVGKDPSLGIRRTTPKARNAFWVWDEVVVLVKGAWRMEYKGLAAALAVAWDTMLSPVDVRSLCLAQLTPRAGGRLDKVLCDMGYRKNLADPNGALFEVERAKTGKAAIGTLGRRSERLLAVYIATLPFTLHPDTPIFHTRGSKPGPRGGKPRPPVPYTKDTLGDDMRAVRNAMFPGDKRQLQDFRRSGAIETVAGVVDPAHLAGKMANSIDTNRELQSTYTPHTATVVRLADEARDRGRTAMRNRAAAGKDAK